MVVTIEDLDSCTANDSHFVFSIDSQWSVKTDPVRLMYAKTDLSLYWYVVWFVSHGYFVNFVQWQTYICHLGTIFVLV